MIYFIQVITRDILKNEENAVNKEELNNLLENVASGAISPKEAADSIKIESFKDLGFAKVDTNRELRQGMSEVIYGKSKTKEQIAGIVGAMIEEKEKTILITRMSREAADYVAQQYNLNYDGFVMTDWWAMSNREGYEATRTTHAPMVSAGNDVFMVCNDCTDMSQDDVKEALEKGEITRGDLQRNAMNVLHFILGTPCILRFLDRISEEEKEAQEQQGDNDFVAADLVTYEADPETGDVVIDASAWENKKGTSEVCGVSILADKMGTYDIEMEMKADLEDLAQLSVTVYIDNIVKTVISIRGTKGEWIKETRDLGFFFGSNHYLKLYFGANGMQLGKIRLKLREGMEALSKHEE